MDFFCKKLKEFSPMLKLGHGLMGVLLICNAS